MQHSFYKDTHFIFLLEHLLKIKNKKELKQEARKLENYVISKQDLILAYRLSIELDDLGIRTTRLQNFIIDSKNPKLIFKFAKEIKKANIKKLQDAIIECGNIVQIATFGCFVKGSEKILIENLISKSDNPKAAYMFLKFVRHCNLNKLKSIILKSKKPRYLFMLAKLTKNKKDIEKIQNLIIEASGNTYVRLFASQIKGADIFKLEERIIATKNAGEMKKFAKVVNSPRLEKLSLLF